MRYLVPVQVNAHFGSVAFIEKKQNKTINSFYTIK